MDLLPLPVAAAGVRLFNVLRLPVTIVGVTYVSYLFCFGLRGSGASEDLSIENWTIIIVVGLFFFVDFVLEVLKACIILNKDRVERKPSVIIIWLVANFIFMFPYEIIGLASGYDSYAALGCIRLLRIFLVPYYWSADWSPMLHNLGIKNLPMQRTLFFMLMWAIIAHVFACAYFAIAYRLLLVGKEYNWLTHDGLVILDDSGHMEFLRGMDYIYLRAIYWSVQTLTTVGYGDITAYDTSETWFSILYFLVSVTLMVLTISNNSLLFKNSDEARAIYHEKISRLMGYASFRRLPVELVGRIKSYHEHQYELVGGVDESQILGELPLNIQSKIRQHVTLDLFTNLSEFRGTNSSVINDVMEKAESCIYSPDDVIVQDNTKVNGIYVIYSGRGAVNSKNSQLLLFLKRGEAFGSKSLQCPYLSMGTFKALTYVEVYFLSGTKYRTICRAHLTNYEYNVLFAKVNKNAKSGQSSKENKAARQKLRKDTIHLKTLQALTVLKKQSKWRLQFLPGHFGKNLRNIVVLICLIFYSIFTAFLVVYTVWPQNYWDSLTYLIIVSFIVDTIMLIDLCPGRMFIYGFVEDGMKVVAPNDIFVQYIAGANLVIDGLAFIPLDIVFLSLGEYHAFGLLRLLKLFHCHELPNLWRKIMMFARVQGVHIGFETSQYIQMMYLLYILIHWPACLWMMSSTGSSSVFGYDTNWQMAADNGAMDIDFKWMSGTTQYFRSLYWTLSTLTTIAYPDTLPTNDVEVVTNILIMFFGCFFLNAVVGSVASVISQFDQQKIRHLAKVSEMKQVINLVNEKVTIPYDIRTKIFRYYSYSWDTYRGVDENEVLSEMSKPLREAVTDCIVGPMIRRIPFFSCCEEGMQQMIFGMLQPRVFLDGDTVITCGNKGKEMYIIERGTVEVTSGDRRFKYAMLRNGDYIGESSLLKATVRTASVYAVGYCDTYFLSKASFMQATDVYPDQFRQVMDQLRIIHTHNMRATKGQHQSKEAAVPPSAIINKMEAKRRKSMVPSGPNDFGALRERSMDIVPISADALNSDVPEELQSIQRAITNTMKVPNKGKNQFSSQRMMFDNSSRRMSTARKMSLSVAQAAAAAPVLLEDHESDVEKLKVNPGDVLLTAQSLRSKHGNRSKAENRALDVSARLGLVSDSVADSLHPSAYGIPEEDADEVKHAEESSEEDSLEDANLDHNLSSSDESSMGSSSSEDDEVKVEIPAEDGSIPFTTSSLVNQGGRDRAKTIESDHQESHIWDCFGYAQILLFYNTSIVPFVDYWIVDIERSKRWHPESEFRLYWDVCILFVIGYNLVMLPFRITVGVSVWYFVLDYALDIMLILDAILNWTVFSVQQQGMLVSDPMSVRSFYFKNRFYTDVVSVIPLDMVVLLFYFSPTSSSRRHSLRIIRALLRLPKLLWTGRLIYYTNQLNRLLDCWHLNGVISLICQLFVVVFLIGHWAACIFFQFSLVHAGEDCVSELDAGYGSDCVYRGTWVAQQIESLKLPDNGGLPLERYLRALNWSIPCLMVMVVGDIHAANQKESLYVFIFMFIGLSVSSFIIGSVISIVASMDPDTVVLIRKREKLIDFMDTHDMSPSLSSRVLSFISFRISSFCQTRFKQETYFNSLPYSLLTATNACTKLPLFRQCSFFDICDDDTLLELCTKLRFQCYGTGDPIILCGDLGTEMFFLEKGTADVVDVNGRTVYATLPVGSYFGEQGLFFHTPRTATIRAAAMCICLILRKTDLEHEFHTRELDISDMSAEFTKLQLTNKIRNEAVTTNLNHVLEPSHKLHKMIAAGDADEIWTDRFRHLFDPQGLLSLVWNCVGLLILLYYAFSIPFFVSFLVDSALVQHSSNYIVFDFFLDVFWIVDIGLKSYIFPFVNRHDEIVVSGEAIWHYYKTKGFFYFDVAASVPFECFALIPGSLDMSVYFWRFSHLIRLYQVGGYVTKVENAIALKYNIRMSWAQSLLLKSAVFFLLTTHLLACASFLIPRYFERHVSMTWTTADGLAVFDEDAGLHDVCHNSDINRCYARSVYYCLSSVTSVGYGDISGYTNVEIIFQIMCSVVGALLCAVVAGSLSAWMENNDAEGDVAFTNKMLEVEKFIKYRKIGKALESIIVSHYTVAWRKDKVIGDVSIFSELSDSLKIDIAHGIHNDTLKLFPAIQGCSVPVRKRMTAAFRTQMKEEGESVYDFGDPGHNIFFVVSGDVTIILPSKNALNVTLDTSAADCLVMLHRKEEVLGRSYGVGDHFGELCFTSKTGLRPDKAKATSHVELLTLTDADFWNIIKLMPLMDQRFLLLSLMISVGSKTHTNCRIDLNATDDTSGDERLKVLYRMASMILADILAVIRSPNLIKPLRRARAAIVNVAHVTEQDLREAAENVLQGGDTATVQVSTKRTMLAMTSGKSPIRTLVRMTDDMDDEEYDTDSSSLAANARLEVVSSDVYLYRTSEKYKKKSNSSKSIRGSPTNGGARSSGKTTFISLGGSSSKWGQMSTSQSNLEAVNEEVQTISLGRAEVEEMPYVKDDDASSVEDTEVALHTDMGQLTPGMRDRTPSVGQQRDRSQSVKSDDQFRDRKYSWVESDKGEARDARSTSGASQLEVGIGRGTSGPDMPPVTSSRRIAVKTVSEDRVLEDGSTNSYQTVGQEDLVTAYLYDVDGDVNGETDDISVRERANTLDATKPVVVWQKPSPAPSTPVNKILVSPGPDDRTNFNMDDIDVMECV